MKRTLKKSYLLRKVLSIVPVERELMLIFRLCTVLAYPPKIKSVREREAHLGAVTLNIFPTALTEESA